MPECHNLVMDLNSAWRIASATIDMIQGEREGGREGRKGRRGGEGREREGQVRGV